VVPPLSPADFFPQVIKCILSGTFGQPVMRIAKF
jgi:hypothetical protein